MALVGPGLLTPCDDAGGAITLHAPPSGMLVITSNVAGESPAAPGGAALPGQAPVGTVFVNTIDNLAWIFDSNGAWTVLPTSAATNVIVSPTTGETPNLPGGTVMPAAPRPADLFVNVPDNQMWVAVPAGAGGAIVWTPLAGTAHGTVTYLSDTEPTAPFTAANNWGFGAAAVVEPDPAVVEPEPGDFWILVNGTMGVFS